MANCSNLTYTTRIETLTRENNDTWRIQAEALFVRNDTWQYISEESQQPPATATGDGKAAAEKAFKDWMSVDCKAKADLILMISPSELKQIKECATSHAVWTKLESIYASKGPARKATLLKKLSQHKMAEGDDVREHITGFFDAVDKLHSMDVEINGDLLTIMLLYSLPASFENFRVAIESRDALPDVENLKIMITDEHDARRRKGEADNPAAMSTNTRKNSSYQQKRDATKFNSSKANGQTEPRDGSHENKEAKPKKKFKCNFCVRKGHKESECLYTKNARENSTSNAEASHCFVAEGTAQNADDRWCIGSGCTAHICNDKDVITNLTATNSEIRLASHTTTPVTAKSDVSLKILDDTNTKITFKDTLYAPNLRTNLISVAKVVDNYLRKDSKYSYAASATTNAEKGIETWHARLGHLNARDLTSMLKSECVTGLHFKEDSD